MSHLDHLGIVKFNTAAELVQLLVTQAHVHGSPVVVVHVVTVAAVQSSHLIHCGIVKLSTAAQVVPELVTQTSVHAAHVVTQPTSTVAAAHVSHFSSSLALLRVTVQPLSFVNTMSSPEKAAAQILAPVAPVHHVDPLGIVKLSTAACSSPELVTHTSLHGAPVQTVPTHRVAASPVSHLSHFRSSTAIICVHSFTLLDLYRIYQASTFISTLSHLAFTPVLVSHIHQYQPSM